MKGEEVHQVAVGPIHAGVIEPGHFRFMCNGETVYHLEIMLGYQHKGVEKLMIKSPSNQLAESICGDSTIGHSLAFARAIEGLSNISVPKRERLIRLIALEMERMAIHVGDIGAIAGDVGYYMAGDVLAVTRTLVINTMLELSGSRFGKGLMKIGGVNYDIDNNIKEKILKMLVEVNDRCDKMVKAMFGHATVLSRLENTGIVSRKRAKEIGLVGLAGRASGLETDSRIFDEYEELGHKIENLKTGDVYARAYLRYLEIKSSTELIKKMLISLHGEISKQRHNMKLTPNNFVFSIVEGWRGEIAHCIFTDHNSFIENYKIKDPSFNNWFGLAIAVRNNQISDFPVCNKSFDLSYCGFDL
jgi:Ni,Fe-hydrogenase III large subunit